jgi:hypothetical protein
MMLWEQHRLHGVPSDCVSELQDNIPEVFPIQKCHMNMDLILNRCGTMEILSVACTCAQLSWIFLWMS